MSRRTAKQSSGHHGVDPRADRIQHRRASARNARAGTAALVPCRFGAPAIALVGIALVATLSTGCRQAGAGGEPRGSGTATATSATAPTSGAPAGNTTTPGAPDSAKPAGAAGGCPVSVTTLVAAMKKSDQYSESTAKEWPGRAGLHRVTCYHGYAVAQTLDDGVSQQIWFLFGYDNASKAWRVLNVGTADLCDGTSVPRDVASHLEGCL
jgi:hypothetical protein